MFDWRPSYGPIDWPRKGTTVLLIKSKKPHYWRAQTLDHFVLGSDVGRLERDRAIGQCRSDIHDRPAVRFQAGDGDLAPVHLAEQVHPDDAIELVRRKLLDGRVRGDGRVVDPRVDRPESLDGARTDPLHLIELRDIGHHRLRLATLGFDIRDQGA